MHLSSVWNRFIWRRGKYLQYIRFLKRLSLKCWPNNFSKINFVNIRFFFWMIILMEQFQSVHNNNWLKRISGSRSLIIKAVRNVMVRKMSLPSVADDELRLKWWERTEIFSGIITWHVSSAYKDLRVPMSVLIKCCRILRDTQTGWDSGSQ